MYNFEHSKTIKILYIMDKFRNIMFSEKGKRINVIDGFKFLFYESLKNDIEWWRCLKRTCKSFYKSENEIIIEKNISHNHEQSNYLNQADSE